MTDITTDQTQDSAPPTELDENVLIISQSRNVVVLPYKIEELQAVLDGGETSCGSLRELVEQRYTFSLSRYKHAYISRFKEAFALVREREKGSVFDALELAIEMFFTRFLHPAIITACKSLDWLDVYLDCLDKNELDDFPFFEIRYEPSKKTKRKS